MEGQKQQVSLLHVYSLIMILLQYIVCHLEHVLLAGYNYAMDPEYLQCLERADEFVQAAELCFERKYHNAAATRAYYATLHAGVAALACYTDDLKARKLLDGNVHDRTPAEFDRRFTRNSKIFEKQKGVMHKLRELRHDADYGNGVTISSARDSVKQARLFLDTIIKRMEADGHYTGIR